MWAMRERSRADGTVEGGRPRRPSQADRRREREARVIAATPELFDARGVSAAQIEDVVRADGVNPAMTHRRCGLSPSSSNLSSAWHQRR